MTTGEDSLDSIVEPAMELAMAEASAGARVGEVPVGAVMLDPQGQVIARAHNLRETARDPLAHAEILVIRRAAQRLGRWRLFDCTLVVTLEPCPMCAGAIVNARVDRVVFGATEPRVGAAGTVFDLLADRRLNHRPEVIGGRHADRCADLLKRFFAARR